MPGAASLSDSVQYLHVTNTETRRLLTASAGMMLWGDMHELKAENKLN